MRALRWSLTTHLALWFTGMSAVVLLSLGAGVAWLIERHFIELDREQLRDKTRLVWHTVAQSPEHWRAHLDDIVGTHPGLRLTVLRAGEPLYASPRFEFPAHLKTDEVRLVQPLRWQQDGATYRVWMAQFPDPDAAPVAWRVLAAWDTHHHDHFMADLHRRLMGCVALAVLLSGGLSGWVARRGLAPLRAMQVQAQMVSAQRLDERMPVEATSVELAELAHSLNEMLARLQADFRRLSDFSSDLAHELRTPISTMLTQTQVTLSQTRRNTEYREVLASNAEELQHLARMVSDMLFLAKAEHHLALPQAQWLDWEDDLTTLLEFYDALAQDKHIHLHLKGHARVRGDRLMLRRAVSNLLSNALRHTPEGGTVQVELHAHAQHVRLSVHNTGPNIPAEVLPRLFDRFYRADPARVHSVSDGLTGVGVGLGLAITQAIAHAHGGCISVRSQGGMTSFDLDIPVP